MSAMPLHSLAFSQNAAILHAGTAPRLDPARLASPPGRGPAGTPGDGTSVDVKTGVEPKRPSMYRIVMLNDDFTPMDFVVHVLERFFSMPPAKAHEIMMTVHLKGAAIVGVFTYEIAETKVAQVMDYARVHQHPLRCRMEKE